MAMSYKFRLCFPSGLDRKDSIDRDRVCAELGFVKRDSRGIAVRISAIKCYEGGVERFIVVSTGSSCGTSREALVIFVKYSTREAAVPERTSVRDYWRKLRLRVRLSASSSISPGLGLAQSSRRNRFVARQERERFVTEKETDLADLQERPLSMSVIIDVGTQSSRESEATRRGLRR